MSGFSKLFGSILDSTIWRESKETKILWITLLAMCDRNGIVEASVPGLADRARLTVTETRIALTCLESADPDSRTKEFEGRRISETDGGWTIINYPKYRDKLSKEERREYWRKWKAERRAADKQTGNGNSNVHTCPPSPHIADADAKAVPPNTPLVPPSPENPSLASSPSPQVPKPIKRHGRPPSTFDFTARIAEAEKQIDRIKLKHEGSPLPPDAKAEVKRLRCLATTCRDQLLASSP